jgi:hypothetical protein
MTPQSPGAVVVRKISDIERLPAIIADANRSGRRKPVPGGGVVRRRDLGETHGSPRPQVKRTRYGKHPRTSKRRILTMPAPPA